MRAAIALSLLLSACESRPPTVIDGSSQQAFERTAALAREDLPVGDKLLFDQAINNVGSRRMSANPQALARITFDGMTARQVVADQRSREQ